jgi:hypothetical protein
MVVQMDRNKGRAWEKIMRGDPIEQEATWESIVEGQEDEEEEPREEEEAREEAEEEALVDESEASANVEDSARRHDEEERERRIERDRIVDIRRRKGFDRERMIDLMAQALDDQEKDERDEAERAHFDEIASWSAGVFPGVKSEPSDATPSRHEVKSEPSDATPSRDATPVPDDDDDDEAHSSYPAFFSSPQNDKDANVEAHWIGPLLLYSVSY